MYICRRLSKILHGMAKVGPNMLIIILLLFGVQGNNINGGYNDVHKYCYSTGYNTLWNLKAIAFLQFHMRMEWIPFPPGWLMPSTRPY